MKNKNNKNGSTTELSRVTLIAMATVLENKTMVQSDLRSNMERQAEMTCPPNMGYQVTACWKKNEFNDFTVTLHGNMYRKAA